MWFLSALLAVSLVSASADTLTCPNGFQLLSTGSKCVKLFSDRATHADAAANCSSSGGHLISITNAIDNRAISTLAATSSTPFWVGIKCTQTNSPASCLWDDQSGNAGTYNAFASGELHLLLNIKSFVKFQDTQLSKSETAFTPLQLDRLPQNGSAETAILL